MLVCLLIVLLHRCWSGFMLGRVTLRFVLDPSQERGVKRFGRLLWADRGTACAPSCRSMHRGHDYSPKFCQPSQPLPPRDAEGHLDQHLGIPDFESIQWMRSPEVGDTINVCTPSALRTSWGSAGRSNFRQAAQSTCRCIANRQTSIVLHHRQPRCPPKPLQLPKPRHPVTTPPPLLSLPIL